MKKKILGLFAAILLTVVLMPGMASAYLFNFDYSGTGVTASGTLTADLISAGSYHITGITGTRNGNAITDFAAGGPAPFDYGQNRIDNILLYPANTKFFAPSDTNGFVFGTNEGWFSPYLAAANSKYYEFKDGTYYSDGLPGIELTSFNVNPVPIPAAIWLFGAGLVGLVGVRRKFSA